MSINSPKVDHENSAEQRVAKTESDAPDESESPDHQPEATGASVVGILGAEQQIHLIHISRNRQRGRRP